jgi:hypothetical protein
MSSSIVSWIKHVEATLESADAQRTHPAFKHSLATRIVNTSIFPICCGPCIVWSIVWRVIAYPFRCICYGSDACGSNVLTQGTDEAISVFMTDVFGRASIAAAPPVNVSTLSDDEKMRLMHIIERIEAIFKYVQTHTGSRGNIDAIYAVCDAYVTPLLPMVRATARAMGGSCGGVALLDHFIVPSRALVTLLRENPTI